MKASLSAIRDSSFIHRNSKNQPSIIHRLSDRPAVAIAISFALGIALAQFCQAYIFIGIVAGSLLLICAAWFALRKNRLNLAWILGLASIALCGLLMAFAHRDRYSSVDIRTLLARNNFPLSEPLAFDGCVIEESERRGDDMATTVELHGIQKKDHWVPVHGKGTLRIGITPQENSSSHAAALARGDRVRGWAVWQVPQNYKNPGATDRVGSLARRDIFIVGRSKSMRLLETIPDDCSNPWTKLANAFRNQVKTSVVSIQNKEHGQQSAILASLIIGDYSGLQTSTREAFQNTGTFHVLVVSGLHVVWITGLLLGFFKFIMIPERIRYLFAALVILAYTCVVGFQASITRCLWIFILYLIGRLIFRKADPLNILLATALILLATEPDWLFEPGFRLSFLSVTAIALTANPIVQIYLKPLWEPMKYCGITDRLFLIPGKWQRRGRTLRTKCELFIEELTDRYFPKLSGSLFWMCRRIASIGLTVGSMIVISISIQLWIEPLLAHDFNRISWIGPLANIVIVPLSSLALASGMIGSLATIIGSTIFIHIGGVLASLLLSIASHIARIPGAWQRCPTPSEAWVLAGIALLFIWGFFEWRKSRVPCFYIFVLLACLSLGSVPIPDNLLNKGPLKAFHEKQELWSKGSPLLKIVFLDVGEGDSIVIRLPNSQIWVLDAGGLRISPALEDSAYAFDIGEAVVSRYLWSQWFTRLDRLILSHTDSDHAGGMAAVMNNFKIGKFEYSPMGADPTILNKLLNVAKENKISTGSPHAGMEERWSTVTVRVLNPVLGTAESSANANSLVLQFSFRRFSALFTGDLEKSAEMAVLRQQGLARNQLLKVAHHGSRSATSDAFLDCIHPRWAVLSAGRNNLYKHPSPEVLTRLRLHNVRALSTMDYGAITVETDGHRYLVKSHVLGILEEGEL
jgi:competence protein ComEC